MSWRDNAAAGAGLHGAEEKKSEDLRDVFSPASDLRALGQKRLYTRWFET